MDGLFRIPENSKVTEMTGGTSLRSRFVGLVKPRSRSSDLFRPGDKTSLALSWIEESDLAREPASAEIAWNKITRTEHGV